MKAATLTTVLALSLRAAGANAAPPLAQAFDMHVPVPPVPVTVAGTPRLVYELYLTNFAAQGLEPISLEVRNAATGDVLVRYAGRDCRS